MLGFLLALCPHQAILPVYAPAPRGYEYRDLLPIRAPRPRGEGWYYDYSSEGWCRVIQPLDTSEPRREEPPRRDEPRWPAPPPRGTPIRLEGGDEVLDLSGTAAASQAGLLPRAPKTDTVKVQYNGGGYAAPPATYGGCTGGFASGAYAAPAYGGYGNGNGGGYANGYAAPEAAYAAPPVTYDEGYVEPARFASGLLPRGGFAPSAFGSRFAFEYRPGLLGRLRGVPTVRFEGNVRDRYGGHPYAVGYAAPAYYGYPGGYYGGYAPTYAAPASYGYDRSLLELGGGRGLRIGGVSSYGNGGGGYVCPPGMVCFPR